MYLCKRLTDAQRHGRGRCSLASGAIGGRRPETADRLGEETGEGDRRAVLEIGADDLDADRQPLARQADRRSGPRQIRQAGETGPEELVVVVLFAPIDEDRALDAVALLVVREGGGGGDRAEQHVVALEEPGPGGAHAPALL